MNRSAPTETLLDSRPQRGFVGPVCLGDAKPGKEGVVFRGHTECAQGRSCRRSPGTVPLHMMFLSHSEKSDT